MAQSIQPILRELRRRLLWARMLEALMLGLTAALGVSLPLMAAWILAGESLRAAMILSLIPLLTGLILLPLPARNAIGLEVLLVRWKADLPLFRVIALMSSAASIHAFILLVSLRYAHWPHWLIPLLLAPATALACVVAVLAGGLSLREVARLMDSQLRLGERLTSTLALELSTRSGSQRVDLAFLSAIRAQAVQMVRAREDSIRFWRLTSAAPAMLTFLALSCGVAALLPARPAKEVVCEQQWQALRGRLVQDLQRHFERLEQSSAPLARQSATRLGELAREFLAPERIKTLTPQQALAELNRSEEALSAALRKMQDSSPDAKSASTGGSPSAADGADAAALSNAANALERDRQELCRLADVVPVIPAPTAPPPLAAQLNEPGGREESHRLVYAAPSALRNGGGSPSAAPRGIPSTVPSSPDDSAWAEACRRAQSIPRTQKPLADYQPIIQAYFKSAVDGE